MKNERIILGSGYVHIGTFTGEALPDPETFCTDENIFSYIQGGATLEYKPSKHVAMDDMGRVSKETIVEEEAILKSGIMTFCGETLDKLCDTARVEEKEAGIGVGKKRHRIVKVGGVGNRKNAKYIICFHHEDPVDGDIWIMIVGSNQAGFVLSFVKDKETVVDVEFRALPHDKEGTLIHYEEEIMEPAPEVAAETTDAHGKK